MIRFRQADPRVPMPGKGVRLPSWKRLLTLPDIFTTKTLVARFDGDQKAASVYLNRWRKEGLISSIGPRAGVHVNLVRDRQADMALWDEAVAWLLPGAMIAGRSALHAAGWTTQIPALTEVMVPGRRSLPEIDGAVLAARPRGWLALARAHVGRPGPLPMVTPAFALADLARHEGWMPDADDLEWDLVDPRAVEDAFRIFGLDRPAFLDDPIASDPTKGRGMSF